MASKYKLSEGSLQQIMKGIEVDNPIMQVLGSKKIQSGSADKERYRILLSDGQHTISFAMLTTSIDDKIGKEGIKNNTVIKILRYITSVINNAGKGDTRVLLILNMEVVVDGDTVGGKIASPVPLTDVDTSKSSSVNKPVTSNDSKQNESSNQCKVEPADTTSNPSDLHGQLTYPISSLSPYHNKWIIKARVANKSAIRTWSNSRGEGKLFSVDLIDESGEIKCTGFRDTVDKFYDYIQVDKVYYISKCQLKPANRQFSTLKNDYEMTMTNDTIFQLCQDDDVDDRIPQMKYDFIKIDKIANMEVGVFVDVCAVCKSTSDIQTFQAKSTGRELKKRELVLIDDSNTAISLTLWGNDAENYDGSNNPVIVVKGAKIGEFGGGKNLSLISSSQFRVNPDIKECHRIRGWYDTEGNMVDATNISARNGTGSFQTPWMSFREVQNQGLGNSEKGDYYQVMGTILLVRSENAIYKACPTETCNKKVVDLENGMYRCEKCGREYPNFKYRLLASMNVGDWSGNQWVSMFSSEVEKVLGMTSQEAGAELEQNPEALANIADTCTFKQYILKCRTKMERYNDEARLKTVVIKVDPINYSEYNAHLIEKIQQLTG